MSDDQAEHRSRQWDVAKEEPVIQDEQKPRKLLSCIQIFICNLAGLLVFALAFFSKTSLLLLITISNNASNTIETKPYALLFIGCLLIAPSVLTLFKSVWKIIFKDSKTPSTQTFIWVVLVESLVALGSAVLTLVAMPKFDILTNVMLLNGIGMLSAIMQVIASAIARGKKRFTATSALSVVLLTAGYIFFAFNYIYCPQWQEDSTRWEMALHVGLAIGGAFLVSLNWWENYAMLFKITFFQNTIRDIKRSRNLVSILSSVVRIAVISTVLGAYVKLSDQDWSSVLSVTSTTKTLVLSLFAIQVISSALCRWMAVVACKMHAVRRSFVLPMIMVSPTALAAFILAIWIPFLNSSSSDNVNSTFATSFATYCSNFSSINGSGLGVMKLLVTDLTHGVCNRVASLEGNVIGYVLLSLSLFSWWIGLMLCTLYIWFLSMHRIERTKELFVRNLYEAVCIDQSMLLNTRFEVVSPQRQNREKDKMTIYLCATMWHETKDEMLKMIISMFRLDRFRPKKNKFNDVAFESHIFFDDAFKQKDNKRSVNEYAETLAEVIKEVYIIFSDKGKGNFRERKPLPDQKIIQTPYGCRLQYTLPEGNSLTVHFKDKNKIRHKKRWSQIMYLYFLLGWKLNRPFHQMYEEKEEGLNNIEDRLKKAKENTYILALDGDTDFQPSAVMLLVDRLRLYPEVGAACGRIHPTGTGPMVWYQKFEYAVGHWLQKTAEHVFGCVLCSPGCFSLFRAAALMDDNVMKRYTTKPTEASHYVQYDQGEDRWLCTLLLQQGWRVEYNAASDSYTNAPQEFKEFYNQRRRWGPSTMANTLDLLASGSLTSQRNKSISKPYILYQTISMAASILGPATVCLMIAGCFKTVLKLDANIGLVLAVIPPVLYIIICYYTKSDTQITIAAVLSVMYAFLMTATLLGIIADMVIENTFMTPSGLFFIGIMAMYVITALLHPHEWQLIICGFLYVICIPSGYLLLAIYSMVNMNNVSWGTRETGTQGAAASAMTQEKSVKCQKMLKFCSYNLEIQVNQEVKVINAPPPVASVAPTVPTEVPSKLEERKPDNIEENFIQQLTDSSAELHLKRGYLEPKEEEFWMDLIERYLKPLESDKAKEERIKAELKDLRNKASFVFFICNALWLVATFFMQTLGSTVTIKIPKVFANGTVDPDGKLFIDPIGLMFLVGFATLLAIQFFAMLWHRIQTLIHFIAYNGTEAAVNRRAMKRHQAMPSDEHELL
ncbi:chitin synthase chs-2-like [Astyanax mexicanus]|uniref:chitin synthase chs-2-like n=1 Tax=Astyanax mexicanus TaxID=7994 RepID=UPI0020CB23F0|nr:chitin synthase chs-2-like [Astyanax mexicanus]